MGNRMRGRGGDELRAGGESTQLGVVVLFATWVAASTVSVAATWHVASDPENPEDRIGAVALQAASGDSILVGEGTYYEHIPVGEKSLTFLSVAGPETTIMSGERKLEGREGSILYTETGAAGELRIAGFTLRNGEGARIDEDTVAGGAVACWNSSDVGILAIENCHFLDNTTVGGGLWTRGGGGIYVQRLSQVYITECRFAGNETNGVGGAVACFMAEGVYSIERCFFEVGLSGLDGGAALYVSGPGTMTVSGCDFRGADVGAPWLFGVVSLAGELELLANRFEDATSSLATKILVSSGGFEYPYQVLVMVDNIFSGPTTGGGEGEEILILVPNGGSQIARNTFADCDVTIEGGGAPLSFDANIVYRGETQIYHAAGGTISCNDFWPDSVTIGSAGLDLVDNMYLDPLFCDEETGDFRIAIQSPCAPENSPEGCGLIGALPAECDIVPVERITWGQIKAGYRE